jgi:hypothetical protein
MSMPISAIRTSAVLRFTPGMVARSSTCSEKRGELHPLDLRAKVRYGLVEVVDVGEYPADHEGMVLREMSFEGFL